MFISSFQDRQWKETIPLTILVANEKETQHLQEIQASSINFSKIPECSNVAGQLHLEDKEHFHLVSSQKNQSYLSHLAHYINHHHFHSYWIHAINWCV